MLPIRIVTKKYDKDKNFFTAILPSDEIVFFDPFVSCAIELSDKDYEKGKGFDFENKAYLVTEFSVQKWDLESYMIIPREGCLIDL